MAHLKRFLLLALIALLAIFAVQNQQILTQPVELSFFKPRQTLMLGFWLVISFTAGSLLFLLVDLPRSFSLKRELARKSQDLARAQSELTRAREEARKASEPLGDRMTAQSQAAAPGVTARPIPDPTDSSRPAPGNLEKRLGL